MLVLATVLLTLVAVVTRPGGHHEWVYAVAGVAATAIVGGIDPAAALGAVTTTAPTIAFLLAVTVLGAAADRAGLFDALAIGAARVAAGSARRLLVGTVVLSAVVTTFLSLDATVVLVTPAVVAVARRTGASPLPHLFAVVLTANAGSLVLPVSNLTNLLAAPRLGGAVTFAATTAPAQAAVLVTLVVILLVRHRRVLGVPIGTDLPPAGTAIADPRAAVVAGGAIAAAVPALLLAEGWALAAATAGAAALATAVAPRAARVRLAERARSGPDGRGAAPRRVRLPWRLGLFVVALFVLVDAASAGLLGEVARTAIADGGTVRTGLVGAVAANALNNLPAYLLLAPAVPDGDLVALLVGVNVGPNLVTVGSLATLLWLTVLRDHGLAPTPLRFLREGLVVAPITLAVGIGVLALTHG